MSDTILSAICPKCGNRVPHEAPQGLCPKCVLACVSDSSDLSSAATATTEIPTLERLAKAFPNLEILELIGRGGMSFVFKARQAQLGRLVALKLLPDRLATNPEFAERFHREGRVLARLNHPNIVTVYDFGTSGGFYYLLMEFVDGANLRQAMQAGRFSPAEALGLVPKVCEALQYAHEKGVLHRDIKPENILLDAKGQLKIADFGIAKLTGSDPANVTLTNAGAALGTPHYMAPEQLEKPATVDHRADLYSLGVVLYELLTGELPIGRFSAPSAKTPMHSNVDDVVFRTLAKDRELRFQTAQEMKVRVEELGSGGRDVPSESKKQPTGLRSDVANSWWTLAGAIGVSLSLLTPLSTLMRLVVGQTDVGPTGLRNALGSVALPAVAGTLMGWLGLNQIRERQASSRTLPLALYASLTWPLLSLMSLSMALPLGLMGSGKSAATLWMGRLLFLFLPAAALASAFGITRKLKQWACGDPNSASSRLWKWLAVAVLVLVMMPSAFWVRRSSPTEAQKALSSALQASDPEVWSPPMAPGEKPNLEAIRQEAAELVGQRHYAEALQRILWYHEHAVEVDPSQSAVRLSFALMQWAQLAGLYPPAQVALVESRDRAAAEFQSGGGHFALFQEVVAMNEVLKQPEASDQLFQLIHTRDPRLARQCYWVMESRLVERKQYDLCAHYVPDLQQRFEQARQAWERARELTDRNPTANRARRHRELEQEFVSTCRRLIEISIGIGAKPKALAIQKQALELLDVEELRTAVKDAEARALVPN